MLLERERELESLWAVVDAARAQRGAVGVVEGEAGIGKTSLLEATAARASADGLRVLRARGTALEREFGFGVVRQLFERAVLHADDDERDALLAGAAGLAAQALGLTAPVDEPAAGEGAFAVQHGFYWLACNLAELAPVVLMVDDAQWGDLPSLRWISYLAGRLDGVAIAVLVAWRSGEPGAPAELLESLRAEPASRTVAPRALSDGASAALVRDAIGEQADARFCQACHETTGGNPFLMRALVDALQGGVIAPTAEATRRVQQLGPAAVQRYVLVRLSRLGDDARALARAVSVLDADAEPRFAYALAGLEPACGAQAAAALEGARILDVGEALRFAHPILRAAVYEDLPAAARASDHRRAAQVLIEGGGDPDRAAVHLLATQPTGDAWVVGRLQEAAERAKGRGAPETGLALVERALSEPAGPEVRPALLLMAGRMARIVARPVAKTYLGEAYQEAADASVRSEAASELAKTIFQTRPADAADVLRRALAALPPDQPDQANRLKLDLLTIETTAMLRPAHEIEHEIRELHAGASRGSPARLAAACLLIWHQELWEQHPQAAAIGELARELSDVRPLIDVYGADYVPLAWAATVLAEWDHLDIANAAFETLLDTAQRTGSAFAFTLAASSRGVHLAWCGDFAEAEADARAALHMATLTGSWTGQRGALMGLVWALTGRGAYAEIDAILVAHGLEHEAGRSPAADGNLLLARSNLRRCEARHDEARDDIVRALELTHSTHSTNPLNRIAVWAPRMLAAGGERERALELAERAVSAARAGQLHGQLGIALHSAGLAERGERAIELLGEAVHVLEASPWHWEHAEALVDIGAALRRANQRQEAREPLREGFELAQRIGALALAERAREELIATGARPRRVVRTGLDSLTASEQRIATMAAEGSSIAEIAQALFVTRKTVETHLYAAYRKLDVNSRDALAAALAQEEQGKPAAAPLAPAAAQPAPGDGVTLLAAVLFTDIVDSTRHAAQLDDRRWQQLLDRHNQVVREELAAHHGREINTTGDGFLATFDSPAQAVRCATAIRHAVPRLGIQIRAGIHAGEIQATGGDISGTTVNVAARILALAGPGDILVSRTVRDLAAASNLNLVDHGHHRLKGVPGNWQLLAVADHST